ANARMKIVQAQTEAEVAQDRLTRVEQAVARVSHSDLLAKTDLGEFYKELSRTVAELLGAGSAVFSNLDENKQTTTIHPSSYGIPETIPPDFITSSVRPGTLTHEIIYKGRIIRTKETSGKEYNPYREFMAMIPIRDFLAVPWQLSDRPLGALAVWNSKTGEGFSEEDAVVLKIIADVAALVRQLTEMRVELAEKGKQEVERLTTLEEAKTTLLNLASHELRGPLATIRGYIDLLATGSLIGKPELTEKAYSTLANRTQQMELLINQMLEVARLEDYRLVLEFKPVDLGEIVRAQVEQAKLSISPEHQIRYIQDCNVISVMGEPERLIQIISNLFDNAIKYSPEGGEITIRTCCDEQSAWMEVTDQGLGIALEDQEIIFQRFGRIVTAQNSHIDGTGLGLHLTRELARMHDGDIEFTSQEGVGSTFIFRIPLNKQG
ncbi:MAG: ATP-binding protein, partial [Candidatus Dormibacteraceae bacterium]